MIEINLLPEHLREVEHTPYPRLISIFVGVILFGMISLYAISAYLEIDALKTQIQQNDNEIADKKIKEKEVLKLKQEIASKEQRRNILIAIVDSKIMWSRKLDQFNSLIGDKYQDTLWFDGILINSTKKNDILASDSPITMRMTSVGHLILDKEEARMSSAGELQDHIRSPKYNFASNIDQEKFKIDKFDFVTNQEINKVIATFPLEIIFQPKSIGTIGPAKSSSKKNSKK